MKSVRLGLVCLGALLPVLAGCGSSSTPAFSVSCRVRTLSTGQLRAAVTVTNNTANPGRALIYGPVLLKLRHFYPVNLAPTQVTLEGQHGQSTYFALSIPQVSPNTPAHLLLRFDLPAKPESIAVTNVRTVQATDSRPLNNPDCLIGKRVGKA